MTSVQRPSFLHCTTLLIAGIYIWAHEPSPISSLAQLGLLRKRRRPLYSNRRRLRSIGRRRYCDEFVMVRGLVFVGVSK